MLIIMFHRMEADSSSVPLQPIVVVDLMQPIDKTQNDSNMLQFVQNFISKVMQDIEGVLGPASSLKPMGHDGAFDSDDAAIESMDS
jgi:brefeldin A-inhibited guanine nucleotide-exchange protein